MSSTHLVPDAMQMHRDACESNQQALDNWERYIRLEVYPDRRMGLSSRIVFTYPNAFKTSVLLDRAFPVLKHAELAPLAPEFMPPIETIEAIGNVRAHAMHAFTTPKHGTVHLLIVSVAEDPRTMHQCDINLGVVSSTSDDGSPAGDGGPLQLTLSMTNRGDLADIHLFFATLIVPFVGCKACTKTQPKMPRCARCWRQLGFPVWYCNQACQRADFARHCREEGCGL